VRVSAGAGDDEAWLEVRDSGVGLTPVQQAHVFDRFWRADPARTRAARAPAPGWASPSSASSSRSTAAT
jgi:signal transduction histidine kinase